MQRLTYPMLAWVWSERKHPSFSGDRTRLLYGHFLTKQNILLPQTIAILLLGIYLENLIMMPIQNLYLDVYKHPNSQSAKLGSKLKCCSVDERLSCGT